MTGGYLGLRRRSVAALVAVAAAVGAILAPHLPDPAPCGYVVEGAEVVPAACSTAAELDARMTAIRATRSGGRW